MVLMKKARPLPPGVEKLLAELLQIRPLGRERGGVYFFANIKGKLTWKYRENEMGMKRMIFKGKNNETAINPSIFLQIYVQPYGVFLLAQFDHYKHIHDVSQLTSSYSQV